MFRRNACILGVALALTACTQAKRSAPEESNHLATTPPAAPSPPATAPASSPPPLAPLARTQRPVTFPDSPEGRDLKEIYLANDFKVVGDQFVKLRELPTGPARDSLKPVMLAIIANEQTDKAFLMAYLLSEWDPHITATAPECRNLIPALARGLHAGNPEKPESAASQLTSAIGSSFLLARLNMEIARALLPDIDFAFNAPVSKPIEGESNDCWTRYILSNLLSTMGEPAVPILVQGLAHGDPWVRKCALDALAITNAPSLPDGWPPESVQMVATTNAARNAASQVAVLLWDKDSQVRSAAAETLGHLRTPKTLNPRERDRLLEMLAEKDPDDPVTRTNAGAVSALAALHPAATATLVKYLAFPTDPHRQGAIAALQEMGPNAVPVLAEFFGDDPLASPENNATAAATDVILKGIGSKAIPGLAKIVREEPNPRARERARQLLAVNVTDAQKEVARMLDIINSTANNPKEPTPARIKIILENACVAQAAIPTFQKLAQSHPDEAVRKAATDAITQINKERVDLP